MINRNFTQLIIVGNGFDLECGLKSSFSDFLIPRFSRLMGELRRSQPETSGWILPENWNLSISRSGLTLWDSVLFDYSGVTRGYQGSWGDVGRLTDFLRGRDSSQLFPWADVESYVDSVVRFGDGPNSPVTLTNQACCYYGSEMRRGRRPLLSGEAAYCHQIIGERSFQPHAIERFMREELGRLEVDLRKYLLNCVHENPCYVERSKGLMTALVKAGLSDAVVGDAPLTNVLSFNYTKPTVDALRESGIAVFENVHGTLRDDNIIIGIDGRLSGPFSKSTRRVEAGIMTDVATLARMDDGDGCAKSVDVIKVFGHSASLADYLYYQDIFNAVDLLNADVVVVFYLYGLNGGGGERGIEAIRGLMTEYGWSVGAPDAEGIADRLMACGKIIVRDSSVVSSEATP